MKISSDTITIESVRTLAAILEIAAESMTRLVASAESGDVSPADAAAEVAESMTNIAIAASAMGRKGGSATSDAKRAAAAANGRKGGRPKKQPTEAKQ